MTTSEKLKQNTVLALALSMFPILFIGIALVVHETVGVLKPEFGDEGMIWIFRAILFGLLAVEMVAVRKYTEKFSANLPPKIDEKLAAFRSMMIVRLALFEAVSLACSVVFILNGDYVLLGIGALAIAIMWYYFPTRTRIRKELQLNELEL